jgi:hypothetical protein
LPSASDVSGQDLAGPYINGDNGTNPRELKLPVMYFDSNDEMFFEDEDLQEESSSAEVV